MQEAYNQEILQKNDGISGYVKSLEAVAGDHEMIETLLANETIANNTQFLEFAQDNPTYKNFILKKVVGNPDIFNKLVKNYQELENTIKAFPEPESKETVLLLKQIQNQLEINAARVLYQGLMKNNGFFSAYKAKSYKHPEFADTEQAYHQSPKVR